MATEEAGGCCPKITDEFRPRMFLLDHEYPGKFHRAKLARGPSILFLIWRVLWVGYHIALIGLSAHLSQFYASTQENRRKWLIFVTNWSLVALTMSTILDLIISFYFYFNKENILRGEKGPMPWYVKVFWVVINIANSMGIVVSVVFWVWLYDYGIGFAGYRILPFLTHGVNIMYIVANLFVTDMPVRILHFFHSSIFFAIYMIFNAIYVIAGGTNNTSKPFIYPLLDWNNSPSLAAVYAIAGVFGSAAAHLIIYTVHLIGNFIFRCRCVDTKD